MASALVAAAKLGMFASLAFGRELDSTGRPETLDDVVQLLEGLRTENDGIRTEIDGIRTELDDLKAQDGALLASEGADID